MSSLKFLKCSSEFAAAAEQSKGKNLRKQELPVVLPRLSPLCNPRGFTFLPSQLGGNLILSRAALVQLTFFEECTPPEIICTTVAISYFILPPYLSSSLCTYEQSCSLQSCNEKLLKIPKRNLKSFGQHSFSFMVPSLWNSLPATLRNVPTLSQFKSQLKTFLFAQAFL